MRITGLATGLDIDQIIKDSMKPYRVRVDKTIQSKDVTEIKQKLYRDIISDAGKFYDKYLDITKNDSILKPSNYQSVVFTSGNESAVQITAGSGAKPGNYTVTGTAAKAAEFKITDPDSMKEGTKLVINGTEFTLTGKDGKEIAKNLNEDLKNHGITVTARYTDFAGSSSTDGTTTNKSGLILEAKTSNDQEISKFTVGGVGIVGSTTKGANATLATITGITMEDVKNGKITIGDKEINLSFSTDATDEEILASLNSSIESQGFSATKDDKGNVTLTSKTLGSAVEDPKIQVNGKGTFSKGTEDTPSSVMITKAQLGTGTQTLNINGKDITIDLSKADWQNDLNGNLAGTGVTAKLEGDNLILTSTELGASSSVKVTRTTGSEQELKGKAAEITITDDKGGIYKYNGTSNNITLDDITFTFKGEIPAGGVSITGKTDVTKSKDMIVNFINDYNTLIKKMNTITMTKHSKGYDPLTADQKKEMSETEIKLWNEKVEQGQLYKDSNLTRIANSMKQTMRTVMEGSGLNLQKIGITPSKDYAGVNHGTFTIDEDKLTKALESNTEDVMNLFIGRPAEGDTTKPEYTSKTGIALQLKDTIYKEMKSSASPLAKKVGFEGTSTFTSNELTKSLSDYEKKIKDMEKDLSKREQALYSKYATLETMMNKLNAQQSQLAAQLGLK